MTGHSSIFNVSFNPWSREAGMDTIFASRQCSVKLWDKRPLNPADIHACFFATRGGFGGLTAC